MFIAFVGLRDMGVVVSSAPSPTLITFTNRFMECDYTGGNVNCPWLSLAGLVVTGILTVYMVAGSLFVGELGWDRLPSKDSMTLILTAHFCFFSKIKIKKI